MLLSASVICNNILKRGFDEQIAITPMKLQKLLYLICCKYFKETGKELISEKFCVWKTGPVLMSLHYYFKPYNSSKIKSYKQSANGDIYLVSEDDFLVFYKVISEVWRKYKNWSAIELANLTVKDGSGWNCAFEEHRDFISTDDFLTDKIIM